MPKVMTDKACWLQDGLLFGLPVVFDTHSDKIKVGDKVLLTYQGQNIATLTVDSKWMPNKPVEALKCYGTSSIEHPAVQMISMERGKYYIGTLMASAVSVLLSKLPGARLHAAADELKVYDKTMPSNTAAWLLFNLNGMVLTVQLVS